MTILETVKDLHQKHYGDTLEVKCTQRNFREEDLKEEIYLRSKIIAWRKVYEEYDNKKDKWVEKKDVKCYLYRNTSKNQPLNLGECNDGSRFTSVNQAINQAKGIINCLGD